MPRANKGRGKGYRRTKNGRYEAYVSEHCHFVSLGTYDSESEAINVVSSYKADRLEERLNRYNHTLSEGAIYEDNYRLVAEALNRNPETVRKYLARYRKEKHHD